MMNRDPARARIIGRHKKLRKEVQQIFIDYEYWNANVKKPDEEPVDPDPFGDLRRLLQALDTLLANDPGHGPIARLDFNRSH